jgi:hypothetical protein
MARAVFALLLASGISTTKSPPVCTGKIMFAPLAADGIETRSPPIL